MKPHVTPLLVLLATGCTLISDAEFARALDQDGDGQRSTQWGGEDCDDGDATVFLGAPERCDAVDSDCDGDLQDGEDALPFHVDADGDGFGDEDADAVLACTAPSGHVADRTDCHDDNPDAYPGAEDACSPDGDIDFNCDGDVVLPTAWFTDSDGDTYGDPATERMACVSDPTEVGNSDDCDDSLDEVFPGATEICNNDLNDACLADPEESICRFRVDDSLAEPGPIRVRAFRADEGQLGLGGPITAGDLDGDGQVEIVAAPREGPFGWSIDLVDGTGSATGVAFSEAAETALTTPDGLPIAPLTLAVGAVTAPDQDDLIFGVADEPAGTSPTGFVGVLTGPFPASTTPLTEFVTTTYRPSTVGGGGGGTGSLAGMDSELGAAIAVGPDLNGDGISDLLVSAPSSFRARSALTEPDRTGFVYLLLSDGREGSRDLSDVMLYDGAVRFWAATGVSTYRPTRGGARGRVGASLAWLPGFSTDAGSIDFVAGAPFSASNAGGSGETGAILVVDAAAAAQERAGESLGFDGAYTRFIMSGPEEDSRFGHAVAGGADLDGDGHTDLAVTAPGYNGEAGAAYVLFGGQPSLNGDDLVAVPSASDADFAMVGVRGDRDDRLGESVALSPDLTGDGRPDLVVGAPGAADGAGEIWIFSGIEPSSDGSATWLERGDATATLSGPTAGASLGEVILAIGDFDQDAGLDRDGQLNADLILGAPSASSDETAGGGIWLLSGMLD